MAVLSERIPQLMPMAAVSAACAAWGLAPSVPVKVEGSAVFLQPDSRLGVYARSAGQVQAVLTLNQSCAGSKGQRLRATPHFAAAC